MTSPAPAILIAGGGTGGHLMPALALAETIRRDRPGWTVHLVGARRGVEQMILPQRDFPFTLLPFEPLYRRQWWRNARWVTLLPRLLRQVERLLDDVRPDLVIGTGGYASGPVVWRASRRHIPTAVQEQNAAPGLATRLLARQVRHVYLGVPEARDLLRPGRETRVLDTGNPVLPPDPGRRPVARERFGIGDDRPVVLVTGGSQGAQAINRAVAGWLDAGGGEGRIVLWVTGRATHPEWIRWHRPPSVQVFDFLDPMADGWSVADLVVSRAGMMTVAEAMAWGVPAILIPLPTAAGDHQTPNARVVANAGAGVFLPQGALTPLRLGHEIDLLITDPKRRATCAAQARLRGRPEAARTILGHLDDLLS